MAALAERSRHFVPLWNELDRLMEVVKRPSLRRVRGEVGRQETRRLSGGSVLDYHRCSILRPVEGLPLALEEQYRITRVASSCDCLKDYRERIFGRSEACSDCHLQDYPVLPPWSGHGDTPVGSPRVHSEE